MGPPEIELSTEKIRNLPMDYISRKRSYLDVSGDYRPAVVLRILFIFQNRNIKLIIRRWLWN